MVQFYQPKDTWSEVGQLFGQGATQGYTNRADELALQKSIESLPPNATPQEVLKKLVGTKTYNPESKQSVVKNWLAAKEAEESERKSKAAEDIEREKIQSTKEIEKSKQDIKKEALEQVYGRPSSTQTTHDNQMTPQSILQPQQGQITGQQAPIAQPAQEFQNPFARMSKDQLVVARGSPFIEIREPAKAQLKRIIDEEEIRQKEKDSNRKYQTEISQEILKDVEKEAKGLVESESALALMEDAIANKDMSFFSPDNIAEEFGIEAFRSPEGALFKTAGKEFFLGNLNRAGARPNQFIEKQIIEMLPKIGRSTAANLSVTRAFRNEQDLKKEKVRLTRNLADELESKLGYVPRNIGQLRDEKLKVFAENKQKELNNDLRALKAIDEKKTQPFEKVAPGTPISKVVAKAILDEFDPDDPKRVQKAEQKAKELGYEF